VNRGAGHGGPAPSLLSDNRFCLLYRERDATAPDEDQVRQAAEAAVRPAKAAFPHLPGRFSVADLPQEKKESAVGRLRGPQVSHDRLRRPRVCSVQNSRYDGRPGLPSPETDIVTTMQALVLRAVKQPLELEQRPPLQAAAGEAVVQLKAAALNRRDYWITQGLYPGIKPPVVLGSDGAGIVTQVGRQADSSWLGTEVVINPGLDWGDSQSAQAKEFTVLGLPRDGTFAGEIAIPVCQLHPKPAAWSWPEAAALPLAGVTAYRAVFSQGHLRSGETVLITGIGGGVATFALQFAAATGAEVWVTSSSQQKIERALQLGAAGGFDYTSEDWPTQFVRQAGAADLIIDSAGGPGYAALLQVAAPGGRIVNYGATAGPPPKLDLFKIFWKQLRLQGSTMGSPADFEAMLAFAAESDVRPVIDASFSLADGNRALDLMKNSPQFGKYLLRME
jgi:zinc-binding alcohol dehydrogenase/oxidoreductase